MPFHTKKENKEGAKGSVENSTRDHFCYLKINVVFLFFLRDLKLSVVEFNLAYDL